MKIRFYKPGDDENHEMILGANRTMTVAPARTIWIPTGWLFSRVGMYFVSRLASRQARKAYSEALDTLCRTDGEDDALGLDEIQQAESFDPPMTTAQAQEMLCALRDSKYLLRGLPLMSMQKADGSKMRVDL